MKNTISLLALVLFSLTGHSQTKPIFFYNENGEELSKEIFIASLKNGQNIDLYFENDTIQYGVAVQREKFGRLNNTAFSELKKYLSELSGAEIDSSKNIVINYITALPNKEQTIQSRTGWNVLHNDYLRKLHKIADINQFWINSPECDNLDYYHENRINWLEDKENLFKKIFFPFEIVNGNYILIRPNGIYYYYLGEHGKHIIWENSKRFFK